MLYRDKVERDYSHLFDNYKYGLIGWAPLAKGVLTGRYNDEIPADAKYNSFPKGSFFLDPHRKPENIARIRKLAPIAEEAGCT